MKNVDMRVSIGLSVAAIFGLVRLIFPASYEPGVELALPPVVIPAIISGVSLISGFMGSRSAARAAQREQDRRNALLRAIKKAASPENFKKIFNVLRPIFREAAIATVGPAVESTVATQLGRRDLTGTGLGQVLTGLAPSVAGVHGLQAAQGQAGVLQQNEINALASGLPVGAGAQSQIGGNNTFNAIADLATGTNQFITDFRGIPKAGRESGSLVLPGQTAGVPGPPPPTLFPSTVPPNTGALTDAQSTLFPTRSTLQR